MIKSRELTDPFSCLNRAAGDEMCFVLLGRDAAAPVAIRAWIEERIRLGKNTADDSQILEAVACMERMQSDGRKRTPGNDQSRLPTLAEAERSLIEQTLERFNGNREQTAASLKMGIRTLCGKLRQYGYPPHGKPGSNVTTLELIASDEHRPALVQADVG